eukprot:14691090-Alexandrium_andersonii.AAC.1
MAAGCGEAARVPPSAPSPERSPPPARGTSSASARHRLPRLCRGACSPPPRSRKRRPLCLVERRP